MPVTHRHVPVALALILGLFSSSCIVGHRNVKRGGKLVTAATAPRLLSATRDELNARISSLYNAVTSFQVTADMTGARGSVYTGEITEYKNLRAIVLFRKPAMIHIEGKLPLGFSTAFNMVSDGVTFKAFLPSKNLFEIGADDAPRTSKNKLENLRPQDFLESMLIMPLDPATEVPSLTDVIDEDNAFYVLNFIRKSDLEVVRQVWFDRVDNLTIVRQRVWNQPSGELVTDTQYSRWTQYSGVMFPAHIDITRPKDEYGLVLDTTDVNDMKMNIPLNDTQFVLNQPEGSQLREIGDPAAAPAAGPQ